MGRPHAEEKVMREKIIEALRKELKQQAGAPGMFAPFVRDKGEEPGAILIDGVVWLTGLADAVMRAVRIASINEQRAALGFPPMQEISGDGSGKALPPISGEDAQSFENFVEHLNPDPETARAAFDLDETLFVSLGKHPRDPEAKVEFIKSGPDLSSPAKIELEELHRAGLRWTPALDPRTKGAHVDPPFYAVLEDDGVVAMIATVLYGGKPMDARGRRMIRVSKAPFPGGPVCKGWVYRDGFFRSPPDETGHSVFRIAVPEE